MRLTCHYLTCQVSFDVPRAVWRAVVFFILGIVKCVVIRDLFSTLLDIYDGTFFTEIERLKTVNYFTKSFIVNVCHLRCLQNTSLSVRGGSRTAATSKMEFFVILVNGWKPLTIITKCFILDVAAVLDPPLTMNLRFPDDLSVNVSQFYFTLRLL